MMRSTVFAALLLSPVLLHAQASVPAQPKSSSASPVLQAGLVEPNMFAAAGKSDAGTAAAHTVRISTGVVPPKLISSVDVTADRSFHWQTAGQFTTARVSMTVDQTGKPVEVKLVRSTGGALDKDVLAAVRQYRFLPGTVSHQPMAMPVNLEVTILRSQLQ